ncbi:MafI family immunity protein [Komagataeibacter xylinus]|uniref:MafI family immunity protein n=1 Tax=Komagataeibacter xylinus TaxID=28448 RepID=UPI00280C0ABF|nr:MafI family immunity protein [Komagataeibacter xylinus]
MTDIREDIRASGHLFVGRMPEGKRLPALEYVDFNECPLAFGTLCDHRCDENVPLSVREFAQIVALNARLPPYHSLGA